jgi:hypothetical protein
VRENATGRLITAPSIRSPMLYPTELQARQALTIQRRQLAPLVSKLRRRSSIGRGGLRPNESLDGIVQMLGSQVTITLDHRQRPPTAEVLHAPRSTPAMMSLDANVWRLQCQVSRSSPLASFRAALYSDRACPRSR